MHASRSRLRIKYYYTYYDSHYFGKSRFQAIAERRAARHIAYLSPMLLLYFCRYCLRAFKEVLTAGAVGTARAMGALRCPAAAALTII